MANATKTNFVPETDGGRKPAFEANGKAQTKTEFGFQREIVDLWLAKSGMLDQTPAELILKCH